MSSCPGAFADPTIWFFLRDAMFLSSIRLRPKVYVIESSFATVSRVRFGAMSRNYHETRRSWQTKEALQYCYEGVRLLSRTAAAEWGRPKSGPLFIMRFHLIISCPTRDLTLLHQYANLLTVTSFRAIHVFLSDTTQYGPSVGVPKTIFAL
jgi:hypothetical protein